MKRAAALVLLTFLTALLLAACERVTPPSDNVTQITDKLESIPLAYGDLEAVTVVPEYPGWYQLWFEDSVGTIRVVRIETTQNLIHKQVEVIPRSGTMATEGM